MRQSTKGSGLIEVLVGTAVVVFILLGLVSAYRALVVVSRENTETLKAVYLLDGGVQALVSIRDSGWDLLATSTIQSDTAYYLEFSDDIWHATTTPEYIDGFFRSFTLSDVYRDANDDIAETGTIDSGTRYAEVVVSWSAGRGTTTRVLSRYITQLID